MITIKYLVEKNTLTAISGLVCIGLGIFCMVGWHTHSLELIQILPGFTHMVYNTAFSFLLLGGGLLILITPYRKIASFLGLFVAGIGLLTLCEYIFNVQLMIDEFFMKSYLIIDPHTPGRMSPYTAISFLGSGIAIIFLSFDKYSSYILLIIGSIIFSLSSSPLLGSAISLSGNTQWYKFMPMALHTSIGFIIYCAGLASYLFNKHFLGKIDLSSTMPAFGFMCSLCFTFLLWRADYQENIQKVQELTLLESEKVLNTIQTRIEESVLDLRGLNSKEQVGAFLSKKAWIKSTELYEKSHPWYDAILWIDPKYQVMFTASFNKNIKEFSNSALLKHDLYERALISKGVSISPVIKFTPNSHGFLICIPRYNESELEGFIMGFINTDYLFEGLLQEGINSGFLLSFYQGNTKFYSSTNIPLPSSEEMIKRVDVKLYNINWHFDIQPSAEFLKDNTHTLVSYLIIIMGLFIGFLLAYVIHSRLITKKQARVLEETQSFLKQQLLESKYLSHDLSLLKEMTDSLQACTTLSKAAPIVAKYCSSLLPKTAGCVYLYNEVLSNLDLFTRWGRASVNTNSFSIKDCRAIKGKLAWYFSGDEINPPCSHSLSTSTKEISLCIPLFNLEKPLGLLQIRYSKGIKSDVNKHASLEETLAKQLTVTLANIKLRELLKNQATRDALTNLYNRRYLDESLPREIYQAKRYTRPVSILMIDIDHFKSVNDTYGHKAGDVVLKNIATLLQALSRKGDITCRYGGEEFLIVLQEATLKDTLNHAQKLRKEVSALKLSWKGKDIKEITISIGVSIFPDQDQTSEDLISAADEALYRAKELGRNRVELRREYETNLP